MQVRLLALFLFLLLRHPVGARADSRLHCFGEPELVKAAQSLLETQGELTPDRVLAAARAAGSDLPALHAIRSEGPVNKVDSWLNRLKSKTAFPIACGEARRSNVRIVVAGIRMGRIRSVKKDTYEVEVPHGTKNAYVAAKAGDDLLRRIPIKNVGTQRITLPQDLPGFSSLQLVGDHGSGPIAMAIFARVSDPSSAPVLSRDERTPASRFRDLRRAHRVAQLRSNALLRRVAREHALCMCKTGQISHRIDGKGPEERLQEAGIQAKVVGEAVSRAQTKGSAMTALEESPSHRMTMIDRRFTDVGIGAAYDRQRRACVVVLLAAWPRAVPKSGP